MKQGKSKKNIHHSSRRQKNNNRDLVDRISALPDSVLGLILSLLPTKNVVATSVLSKRWKLVWTTIHNLDFCLEGCSEEHAESENTKFVRFVNRVLLHNEAGLLNKFHLVWKPRCISTHAISWISTAIRRNVHELFLCVKTPLGPSTIPETLKLPISIFNCNSLQSLELKGDISLSAAIVVCLPSLESLKLISVDFQSEEAFEKLVSGCPQLTDLHLHIDFLYEDDDFTYIISSTSLRRLEVCFDEYQCSLNLRASSLEYLEITGYISQIFVQKNLSSLVEANLRMTLIEDDFSNHSFVEAVRTFDCAKSLTLASEVMQALGCAKFFLSTEFKRLEKFEARICCSCNCSSLHDLIEHAECLEVLTIIQEETCMHENNDDHPKWTNPVEVPRCLKTVVFEGYRGFDNEREIIGYILKHGSALEVIKIYYGMFMRENVKLELVQEICKFPRKSAVCAVEFFSSRFDYLFPADDSR